MSGPTAVVPYLALEPHPHLVASQCDGCGARFLQPRAACPACGIRAFTAVELPTTGTVRTWSVVRRAPHDALVPVPYVPAVVELADGTAVSGTLVGTDPADVTGGLAVELVAVEHESGVAFGFRPA